jgi:DNA polymerase-1
MRVVIDIEANGLENPTKVWLIVCKELETGKLHVFRKPSDDPQSLAAFSDFTNLVSGYIGHHICGYDIPVLRNLLGPLSPTILKNLSHTEDSSDLRFVDTLLISKMVDYNRVGGHSLETYGYDLDFPKGDWTDFSKWSLGLEEYCIRDVELTQKVYEKYSKFIHRADYRDSIKLEHDFQFIVNALHKNGFAFNTKKAQGLLEKVEKELGELDGQIHTAFPPREVLIREFIPRATKHGTISRSSVPRSLLDNIHTYEVGKTYRHTKFEEFNPASHKQLIDVLWEAGWKPEDKTQTHIEWTRRLNQAKRSKEPQSAVDLELSLCDNALSKLEKYGWKINENNLATLPASAPSSARLLAKRILLEARRRTLTEWLGLVTEDGRIHGQFYGMGAWTHRMAHQKPNTANIPNEFDTAGKRKLLGKEMRSLWCAPRNRLLVGTDAEGIQLRIFAHLINDQEFTNALVAGKKEDKSDPHSLNQRILGSVCKTRAAAKRFIYALLLGAGLGKLAEILGCSEDEARRALEHLMERYEGFTYLKENIIPADAKRGWFKGLDGRPVRIPGDTVSSRRHLAMSGYLQNGEAVIMKKATLKWHNKLADLDSLLVNFVHDEWQVETPNNMETALTVAKLLADSLRVVGEELKLKCPLAGSYWNDDLNDYTIATNWAYTH